MPTNNQILLSEIVTRNFADNPQSRQSGLLPTAFGTDQARTGPSHSGTKLRQRNSGTGKSQSPTFRPLLHTSRQCTEQSPGTCPGTYPYSDWHTVKAEEHAGNGSQTPSGEKREFPKRHQLARPLQPQKPNGHPPCSPVIVEASQHKTTNYRTSPDIKHRLTRISRQG